MAYLVGYISKQEREILESRGWELEDPRDYDLIGEGKLLSEEYAQKHAQDESEPVVVFVDSDLFTIMDGADWDKNQP